MNESNHQDVNIKVEYCESPDHERISMTEEDIHNIKQEQEYVLTPTKVPSSNCIRNIKREEFVLSPTSGSSKEYERISMDMYENDTYQHSAIKSEEKPSSPSSINSESECDSDLFSKVQQNQKPTPRRRKQGKRTRKQVKHTRKLSGDKPYQCEVCYKTFALSYYLLRHTRIHTGERPYECEICQKSFRVNSNLSAHRKTHSTEKTYVCEICRKSFRCSRNLTRHARIHLVDKPYKCEICTKCYKESTAYRYHMRTHTGIKPYKCEVCHKSFILRGGLLAHKRRLHSEVKSLQLL